MPRQQFPPTSASPEVARSYHLAAQWSRSADFQRAFDSAMTDEKSHEFALADPQGFLLDAGVPVPDGLDVKFMELPPRGMPGPGFEQFAIRLFNCSTYWIQDRPPPTGGPGLWRLVTVCFGFEITRNRGAGPVGSFGTSSGQ